MTSAYLIDQEWNLLYIKRYPVINCTHVILCVQINPYCLLLLFMMELIRLQQIFPTILIPLTFLSFKTVRHFS